ncbi:MAG: hypothetical protein PHE61_06250 [Candidatus Omnitrophica bacterium]|nr:hypothetical protein [Candidatus Omnitrophota bacterium]
MYFSYRFVLRSAPVLIIAILGVFILSPCFGEENVAAVSQAAEYRVRVSRVVSVLNELCKVLTFPDEIKAGHTPPDEVLNITPRIRDKFVAAQKELESLTPPAGYEVSHKLLLRGFDFYIGSLNFMIQGINRAEQKQDSAKSFEEMKKFLAEGNDAFAKANSLVEELDKSKK